MLEFSPQKSDRLGACWVSLRKATNLLCLHPGAVPVKCMSPIREGNTNNNWIYGKFRNHDVILQFSENINFAIESKSREIRWSS